METSLRDRDGAPENGDEAPAPMETEDVVETKAGDAPPSSEAPTNAEAMPDEAASGGGQAADPADAKSEESQEAPAPEEARSGADDGAGGTGTEAEDGGGPSTDPTGRFKRPTPSSLQEWEHFETVDDDVAQIRLARAMGYPPSW